MKTAELKATIREKTGAQMAGKLRQENKVPAVVYGESGTRHVEVDYVPMSKILNSPDLFLINLDTGKENTRVIIQDAQYHPLTDKILHVDFLEAAVGKMAKLNIPLKMVGTSVGVMEGGMLVVKSRYLRVRGIPADLPESIDVDITELTIGKSIQVKDIKGFDILDPENSVIVRVKAARTLEEIAPIVEEEELEEGEEGLEGEEGAEGVEGAEGAEGAPKAEGEAGKTEGGEGAPKAEGGDQKQGGGHDKGDHGKGKGN